MRRKAPSQRLIEAVQVTVELTNTALSEAGGAYFVDALSDLPEEQVLDALRRCRIELRGHLTLGEVLSRITDGRPGPEVAWATLPWDESVTAVLTKEQMHAMRIATPLYREGDLVAARMAFKEAYTELLVQARGRHEPVQWEVSLGHDPYGRIPAIKEAVAEGKLRADEVAHILPAHMLESGSRPALPPGNEGLKSITEVLGTMGLPKGEEK